MKAEIKTRIEMINRGEVPEGYKKTKVGIIPEDWKVRGALDTFDLLGGHAFRSKDARNKGIRWLKIANVDMGTIDWTSIDYLPKDYINDYEKYILQENDIVMALTRPILNGNLKIAKLKKTDAPSLLNQRVGKIETDTGTDVRYIYYYLSKPSTVNRIESLIAGTDPPNLGKGELQKLDIPIPSFLEQQKIAQILSIWDRVIELKEKLIEEKKEQQKGLMQKLLTSEIRLPGFDGEWKEVRLGEVLFFPRKESIVNPQEYYLLTVRLHLKGIEGTNKKPNKTKKGRPYYFRKPNELLIGRQNFHNGGIGIVPEGMNDYIASNAISTLESRDGDIRFYYYYLSNENFYKKVGHMIGGTGQKEISESEMKKLKLFIPKSTKEQKGIAQILATADKEIELLNQELEQIKLQKKGLMQLLLTGIVRVKV